MELSEELKAKLVAFKENPQAAGLLWEDFTSYSRGKERIPTMFTAKLENIRITIVRQHRYYPDDWVFSCAVLGYDTHRLEGATSPQEAARLALEQCRSTVNWLASLFNNLEENYEEDGL